MCPTKRTKRTEQHTRKKEKFSHMLAILSRRARLYSTTASQSIDNTISQSIPSSSTAISSVEHESSSQSLKRSRWRIRPMGEQDTPPFRLTDAFLSKYSDRDPPFGFNGLGEVVYRRTYSRDLSTDDGSVRKERWFETVARVVNGTYNMQKRWIDRHSLGWDPRRAQQSAQRMYDKIFNMKFLPPGRGMRSIYYIFISSSSSHHTST